ncbi:Protein Y48G1A.4 [Aphelenchoides avenae]|nr:Protein Y48G1A.4 [Aphelenchus avenae]
MSKPKKKPTASAAKKQTPKEKKMNPFDLKFAKKKTGESAKQREGAPLVSRKRAMERRQQTLGVEVKQMWKKNKILDQRIAEKNVKLSAEEKAEKRFMMQRARVLKTHKKFNLSAYDENAKEGVCKPFMRATTKCGRRTR